MSPTKSMQSPATPGMAGASTNGGSGSGVAHGAAVSPQSQLKSPVKWLHPQLEVLNVRYTHIFIHMDVYVDTFIYTPIQL